jgi:hypothetical protein
MLSLAVRGENENTCYENKILEHFRGEGNAYGGQMYDRSALLRRVGSEINN